MPVDSAIILAAGRGSRLGAMTEQLPKCLVSLGGRALLDWQIAAFAAAGIARVTLVGGHGIDHLRGRDCEVVENVRWAQGNMVTSLLCAHARLLAEPCLVGYSDIVFHPSNLTALRDCASDIALTYDRHWLELWQARFADPRDDAESFRVEDGRLREIGQRVADVSSVGGQFMGLLRFSPRGWRTVEAFLSALSREQVDRLDTTGLLALLLRNGVEIDAFPVDGRWCEIDSPEDLRLYAAKLDAADRQGRRWRHDWRWGAMHARVAP
jgi:choline kinase